MFIPPTKMSSALLHQIPGIDSQGVELLQAVGVESLGTLSHSEPGTLLEEMEQAKRHLELVGNLPSIDDLISWIEVARQIDGIEGPPLVTRLEGPVEWVPIEVLPALPVPPETMKENKIRVSEVPEMTEFLSKEELFEARLVEDGEAKPGGVPVREIAPKSIVREEGGTPEKREGAKIEPLKRNAGFDIRKTATPELNVGRKLHSRRYIRGVLHPTPGRVKMGGFFALCTLILFPLNFVAGGLVLTLGKDWELGQKLWLLAVPIAFLVFGLCYLVVSRPVKCRVCGQPLYISKSCRRNPKAHHMPLLGYIIPTVIHFLIFHWFCCMYCGTSVRLKK